MIRRRYVTARDGEWVQPITRGYRMACCTCGVIHRVDFRVVEGRVRFRATRVGRRRVKG